MCEFVRYAILLVALSVLSPVYAQESVNINTDSIKQIAKGLDGIGVRRAAAIVRHRKENGRFDAIDDLAKVKGISKSLVEKNRDRIILNGADED